MAKKRRSTKKNNQPNFMWLIVGGVIASMVLVFIAVSALRSDTVAARDIEGIVEYSNLSRDHVDAPQFVNNGLPPVGGEHYNIWQNCGVYDRPLDPGNAVHSLEHGAVWITYNPDDVSADDIAQMAEITEGGTHRLMSPFPGQISPVVVSAWGLQLQLDSADDPRLEQFVIGYEKGPQTPEPGAACTQGTAM